MKRKIVYSTEFIAFLSISALKSEPVLEVIFFDCGSIVCMSYFISTVHKRTVCKLVICMLFI